MSERRRAVVLFGDPHKIGPFLTDLRDRDLAVLLICAPGASSLARRAMSLFGTPGHPLGELADVSIRDGGDLTGIVDRMTRWAREYDVVGVLVAAEVFVEPGAVLCDLFGLPGVGLRAARVCRDKSLQRRYLGQWSPKSVLVTAGNTSVIEEFAGRFSVVVKPLKLESSIGVRVVPDAAALAAVLADLEPGAELLVEERVVGREYNVDAIVVDGKPLATMITQKGTNETTSDYFVELVHTTPPTNLADGEVRRIAEVHVAVIARLAFETGMAHAEYRVTDDGRVVLMEIAARAPGDACLPLYRLATGDAVEPVLVDAALGRPTGYAYRPRRRARQVYFEHTPGPLADVRVDWPGVDAEWLVKTTGIWPDLHPVGAADPATVHEVLVLKERGEVLLPLTESATRAVTAVFDAPLDADIDEVEAWVRAAVTVESG